MQRVLIIARADPRGSLYFLGKHLRAANVADARVVVLGDVGDHAWQDLAELRDGGQELRDLLLRAEVLHLVDLLPEDLDVFDNLLLQRTEGTARVVLQIDNNEHAQPAAMLRRAQEHQWPLICTDPSAFLDTGKVGPFLPPLTPTWCGLWTPQLPGTRGRDRSGQSTVFCGNQTPFRYIPAFEKLIDRVDEAALANPRIRTEFLVTRSYRRWLQRQRAAQLVVTLHRPGHSANILHALAQGVRVVADVPEPVLDAWASFASGVRPPVTPMGELDSALRRLRFDAEPNELCHGWASSVLDPQRWLRVCEALYEGASGREAAAAIEAEAA